MIKNIAFNSRTNVEFLNIFMIMNILPVKIENIYIKEMIFNDDNRMQNKFSFFYMPLIYLFFGTKLSDINFYEMGDY